jgi:CHASE2 domain-containing sensor protein
MRLKWSTRRWAMLEVAKTVRSINVPPPKPKSRGFWFDYVFNMRNVYSTASIFGLIALIYYSPGNIEIFDPIQQALADFSFTDIVYSQWRQDDAVVDENIILVNVGRNRAEIAMQTKVLAAMQPKVIGIDPLLSSEKEPEVDLALIDAIQSAKYVVMAAKLSDWNNDEKKPMFLKLQPPHPKFQLPNVSYGHTSFTADDKSKNTAQTIRDFESTYKVKDSTLMKKDTTITAFALEVAERWKPGIIKQIKERGEDKELINYRGSFNKFIQIDIEPEMALDSAVAMYGSLVKGKIVLLGFMGQPFDNPNDIRNKFYTPAAKKYVGKNPPDMYAIVLHANIVSMLIRNELITQMPDWVGYVMAVIVCYLNMALFHWITIKFPSFAGGEMKVIQLIQAGILVMGAMGSLNTFNYQIELSLTLAIILLSSDVMEIHESSVKRLIERIQDNRR